MSETFLSSLPYESYKHLPEEVICVICQQPSLDNVNVCISGHNCCRTCADRWVASSNDNSDKCPSCRGTLHRPRLNTQLVWVKNTAINSLVDTMQMKCPNVRFGCTYLCKLKDMKAHTDTCEYSEMACKCKGCDWKGPKCKWQDHMNEVDHGRFLVDMMLGMQTVCANNDNAMIENKKAVEESQRTFYTQFFEPLNVQVKSMETRIYSMTLSLKCIESYTKPRDGSSARSKRRDRKTQKDVDDAKMALSNSETEVASLKRKLEIAQIPSEMISAREKEIADARDRFFSERDEARHLAFTSQQCIHEQHTLLKRMLPGTVANCPCTLSSCGEGGEQRNYGDYLRSLVREQ